MNLPDHLCPACKQPLTVEFNPSYTLTFETIVYCNHGPCSSMLANDGIQGFDTPETLAVKLIHQLNKQPDWEDDNA